MEDFRQYRSQAISFERQAAEARRAGARAELLELARLWNQLADETERKARESGAHVGLDGERHEAARA